MVYLQARGVLWGCRRLARYSLPLVVLLSLVLGCSGSSDSPWSSGGLPGPQDEGSGSEDGNGGGFWRYLLPFLFLHEEHYNVDNLRIGRLEVAPADAYAGEPSEISFRIVSLKKGEVKDTRIDVVFRQEEAAQQVAAETEPLYLEVAGFSLSTLGGTSPEPQLKTALYGGQTVIEREFVPGTRNRVVDVRIFFQVPTYTEAGAYDLLLYVNGQPIETKKTVDVRPATAPDLVFGLADVSSYVFALSGSPPPTYYDESTPDFLMSVELLNPGLGFTDSFDIDVGLEILGKTYPLQVVQRDIYDYSVLAEKASFKAMGQGSKQGASLSVYLSPSAYEALAGLRRDRTCYLLIEIDPSDEVQEMDEGNNKARIPVAFSAMRDQNTWRGTASLQGGGASAMEMPPRPTPDVIAAGKWEKVYDVMYPEPPSCDGYPYVEIPDPNAPTGKREVWEPTSPHWDQCRRDRPKAAEAATTSWKVGGGDWDLLTATFKHSDNYLYYQAVNVDDPKIPVLPWGVWFGADGDATLKIAYLMENTLQVLKTDIYAKMSADTISLDPNSPADAEKCSQYKLYVDLITLDEQLFLTDYTFPCGRQDLQFDLFNYAFDLQAGPLVIPIILGISVQMTGGVTGDVGLKGFVSLYGERAGQVTIEAEAGPYMHSKANAGVALDALVAQAGVNCNLKLMDGSIKGHANFTVFRDLEVAQLSVDVPWTFEGFDGRLAPYVDLPLWGREEIELVNWSGASLPGTLYDRTWFMGSPKGVFVRVLGDKTYPDVEDDKSPVSDKLEQIVWDNNEKLNYDNPPIPGNVNPREEYIYWHGKFNFQGEASGSPFTFHLQNFHDVIIWKEGGPSYTNYFMWNDEDGYILDPNKPLTGYWCSEEGYRETDRYVVFENIPAGEWKVAFVKRPCVCAEVCPDQQATCPDAQKYRSCPEYSLGNYRGYWVKGEVPTDQPIWEAFFYPHQKPDGTPLPNIPSSSQLANDQYDSPPSCVLMLDHPGLDQKSGKICTYPPVMYDKPYTAHFVRYSPKTPDKGWIDHNNYNFFAASDNQSGVAAFLAENNSANLEKAFNDEGDYVVNEWKRLYYTTQPITLNNKDDYKLQAVYTKNGDGRTFFDFEVVPLNGYLTEICLAKDGDVSRDYCFTGQNMHARLCELLGGDVKQCSLDQTAVPEDIRRKLEPHLLVNDTELSFDMASFVDGVSTFLTEYGQQPAPDFCLASYRAGGVLESDKTEGTEAEPKLTDYVVGSSFMNTVLSVDDQVLLEDKPQVLSKVDSRLDDPGQPKKPTVKWRDIPRDGTATIGNVVYDTYFVNEMLGSKKNVKNGKHIVEASFDSGDSCSTAENTTPQKGVAQLRSARFRSYESLEEKENRYLFDVYLYKSGAAMHQSSLYKNRVTQQPDPDPNTPAAIGNSPLPQAIIPNQKLSQPWTGEAYYILQAFDLEDVCRGPDPGNSNQTPDFHCQYSFPTGAGGKFKAAGIWDGQALDMFHNEREGRKWFALGRADAPLRMVVDRLKYQYKSYETGDPNDVAFIDDLYGRSFYSMFNVSPRDPAKPDHTLSIIHEEITDGRDEPFKLDFQLKSTGQDDMLILFLDQDSNIVNALQNKFGQGTSTDISPVLPYDFNKLDFTFDPDYGKSGGDCMISELSWLDGGRCDLLQSQSCLNVVMLANVPLPTRYGDPAKPHTGECLDTEGSFLVADAAGATYPDTFESTYCANGKCVPHLGQGQASSTTMNNVAGYMAFSNFLFEIRAKDGGCITDVNEMLKLLYTFKLVYGKAANPGPECYKPPPDPNDPAHPVPDL